MATVTTLQQPNISFIKKKHPYYAVVRMEGFDSCMIRKFIGTGGNNIRLLENMTRCTLSVRDLSDIRNRIGCVHVIIYAQTMEALNYAKSMIADHTYNIRHFSSVPSNQVQHSYVQPANIGNDVHHANSNEEMVDNVETTCEYEETTSLLSELKELKRKIEWMENKLIDQDFTISCLLENRL